MNKDNRNPTVRVFPMKHSVIVLAAHKSNGAESTPEFGVPALTSLLESIERQVELEDLAGLDAVKGIAGRWLEVDAAPSVAFWVRDGSSE
jgi:hypothetical protein